METRGTFASERRNYVTCGEARRRIRFYFPHGPTPRRKRRFFAFAPEKPPISGKGVSRYNGKLTMRRERQLETMPGGSPSSSRRTHGTLAGHIGGVCRRIGVVPSRFGKRVSRNNGKRDQGLGEGSVNLQPAFAACASLTLMGVSCKLMLVIALAADAETRSAGSEVTTWGFRERGFPKQPVSCWQGVRGFALSAFHYMLFGEEQLYGHL